MECSLLCCCSPALLSHTQAGVQGMGGSHGEGSNTAYPCSCLQCWQGAEALFLSLLICTLCSPGFNMQEVREKRCEESLQWRDLSCAPDSMQVTSFVCLSIPSGRWCLSTSVPGQLLLSPVRQEAGTEGRWVAGKGMCAAPAPPGWCWKDFSAA